MSGLYPYTFAWRQGPFGPNPVRAALYGRRCRLLVSSRRMRSALVEFEDGTRHVVSRRALRKADPHA